MNSKHFSEFKINVMSGLNDAETVKNYETFIAEVGREHTKSVRLLKEKRYLCKTCDYTTYFSNDMKIHNLLHNVAQDGDNSASRLILEATRAAEKIATKFKSEELCFYKCGKCEFWTTKKYMYENHKRKHVPNKFVCVHCGYGANSKKNIARHFKLCEKRKEAMNL